MSKEEVPQQCGTFLVSQVWSVRAESRTFVWVLIIYFEASNLASSEVNSFTIE